MVDMVAAIYKNAESRIKRYPCKSNRASQIGYYVPELNGCIRRGVYERTHWQQKEMHDARVQLIFDEGNEQERWVLRALADAGIDIIEQQTAYEWPVYNITGHVDGKILVDGVAYPIEIKSMHPAIWESINCFDDFKRKSWTRVYMAQGTVYMLCQGVDKAVFLLKNKSSGQYKQIEVGLDFELGEYCLKAVEQINTHVAAGTLPDKIKDIEVCKQCPFKLVCMPDVQFGVELKITDDPDFESRLKSYLELKPSKLEADKIYDVIKSRCKAECGESPEFKICIGSYLVSGKKDTKNALRISIEEV